MYPLTQSESIISNPDFCNSLPQTIFGHHTKRYCYSLLIFQRQAIVNSSNALKQGVDPLVRHLTFCMIHALFFPLTLTLSWFSQHEKSNLGTGKTDQQLRALVDEEEDWGVVANTHMSADSHL